MVERGSRRNGLAGGRGQHLWKKLPGEGELLDFFPWDEKRVPAWFGRTVMGTEFVVGHKHLVALSVLPSSSSTLGSKTLSPHSWAEGGDWHKPAQGGKGDCTEPGPCPGGRSSRHSGREQQANSWVRQGLGYFFSSLLACGWIFLLFSSLLLSAVSTEMWEFANLSQWRGEARADLGVLVRDQGSREGHCNSGNKKTRAHSLIVSLGRGRLSLSSFLLRLQGRLLTSVQLLALKFIPPGDCKRFFSASFLALQCQMPFPQGPGQTMGTRETLLPRGCSPLPYGRGLGVGSWGAFLFSSYTFKGLKKKTVLIAHAKCQMSVSGFQRGKLSERIKGWVIYRSLPGGCGTETNW